MEKVDRKICLDSDIIIEFLKSNDKTKEKINSLNASFYATPINIFEVWYGKNKQEGTKGFLDNITIIDIDKETGLLSAEIMEKLRDDGKLIEFRDVMIASACIINNVELLTNNRKHFERLKRFGLKLV